MFHQSFRVQASFGEVLGAPCRWDPAVPSLYFARYFSHLPFQDPYSSGLANHVSFSTAKKYKIFADTTIWSFWNVEQTGKMGSVGKFHSLNMSLLLLTPTRMKTSDFTWYSLPQESSDVINEHPLDFFIIWH